MIHPSLLTAAFGSCNVTRRSLVFYFVSLVLSAANFLPLLVESKLETVTMPQSTEFYLNICYLLSLPLLFEFFVDVAVAQISPSANKPVEPRLGYFLILIALFLPVVTVDKNIQDSTSPWKILSIICFASFLQSLIIIGQYGKLNFRTKGHWRCCRCIAIIFLYVASHVCLNLGVAYHTSDGDLNDAQKWCLGCAVICAVGCLALHCQYSKRYLVDFVRYRIQGVPGPMWLVDDYVAVALQSIIFVSFVLNCFGCFGLVNDSGNFHGQTNSVVINLIVLGLCAAILPGRVVRKNFMLLNDKMAVKDTFIRYVSHEIRSPLSTTSLGLNYLLDRLKADKIQLSEVLEVVQESVVTCELAMNTLNDFLMLDKIESNMVEISTTMRKASEFMVDAVRPFSLQAASMNVTLLCCVESLDGISGMDTLIDIDAYKMNQVLRNLLSNALKFTPRGGSVSVSMTIKENTIAPVETKDIYQRVDGRRYSVIFAVKDSGCGISAENLPKLFGQYVQFDAAKLQGGKGSGLGLWLSKAIVELHGGRIGAESKGEGQGSTFWFELPCVLSDDYSIALRDSEHSNAMLAGTGKMSLTDSFHQPTTKNKKADDLGSFELVHHNDIESGNVTRNSLQSPTSVGSVRVNSSENLSLSAGIHSEGGAAKTLFVDLQDPKFAHNRSQGWDHSGGASRCLEKKLRALLVDDSTIARKMVERSLATVDVECTHARSGRDAVEKVRESMKSNGSAGSTGYDVILIDHYMPEMNGPEAVKVIRDELGYKGVIMGVSGNASADSEFEVLLSVGKINRVVVKPFNLDVFVECMNNCVGEVVPT